jgi:hypothetical protein
MEFYANFQGIPKIDRSVIPTIIFQIIIQKHSATKISPLFSSMAHVNFPQIPSKHWKSHWKIHFPIFRIFFQPTPARMLKTKRRKFHHFPKIEITIFSFSLKS